MYFDRRLWAMMAGVRGRVALAIALGLAAAGFGIARLALMGVLLARVVAGERLEALLLPAIGIAVAVVARALLDHRRTVVANENAALIQERLRLRLFDRIAALGPAWFAGERTGSVMLAVVDGVEQLQTFFGQYLPQLCVAALTPLAIFAVVAFWDAPVAAVMLAFALAALVLPMTFHRRDRASALQRSADFKAFGAEFLDAVQGLPTLKAFGQSAAWGERLAARARALSDSTFWVLSTGLMTRGITDGCIALGAAAALALGAFRVAAGDMGVEALLVVLMAGTEIFRPLRDLRGVLHQGMVGQSAAVAVNALLDARPEIEPDAAIPAPGAASAGAAPDIVVEGLRFRYPGGRRIVHDGLSFRVAAGERVGIVGASGSGKSSLTRLLLRLNEFEAGRVLIGGEDIRAIPQARLRRLFAVVHQESYLFHGTVADNLRLGRPEADDAALEAAARAANAHDFIAKLPQGYATMIGERGVALSGGQRQRLAIARALLRDAPILILDEALSAVDAENEAAIEEAIRRLSAGRTTLVLAHRLSSVVDADRILVLEGGRVAESGTHQALLAADGPYRRLMGAQAEERGAGAAATLDDALPEIADATPGEAMPPADPTPPAETSTVGLLRQLFGFVRPWARELGIIVASGVGRVAAMIGVGILGALVVAAVRNGAGFGLLLAGLLVTAPLAGLLHWLESWLAHDMAYRLLAEMRIGLYRKLDLLAPAYLVRRRSGDLIALATQDIETIEFFFAHTVAPAAIAVLVPATVLATLALVAWPTALALLPFVLYAGLAPALARRRVDRLGAEARDRLGLVAAFVTETIQGLADLVAFAAVGGRRSAFGAALGTYGRIRLDLQRDLSRETARLEVTAGLGGLAVALAGAAAVASGALAGTTLPILVLLALAAFVPIAEIAQVARQLADTFAATRRLTSVEALQPAVTDGPEDPPEAAGGAAIAFEDVAFAYPGRPAPALAGISLAIAPGETIALVGPSGAGKTTLANLLLRFWDPDAGAIRLGGRDLRRLRLDALRRQIALVAQDTYLFNETLRANVLLARPEASEAELRAALERAALAEFVAALPEGLETRVGERGVQLSGGQRQRVAIARAFLRNAPTLILDEATSHLDAVNEAEIRRALADLMRQRTTIVIAHRLSTVRNADRIVVLAGGRVAEIGSHAELLARGGLYARLVRRQMSGLAAE